VHKNETKNRWFFTPNICVYIQTIIGAQDEAHVPSRRLSAPQIGSSVRVGQRIQQMAGNERNVVQIAGNV